MITEQTITHEGTLAANRTKMVFDENSIAHLQSVLVEMYSNPRLATIREYATNAADSHAAAGNSNPIEITLPSEMDRTYKVRDYGTGMSVKTIMENFSRYGWSSKRETNEQTGMLGLGCKAGLAFTNQFTMESIHEGIKATVLVTRETDGGAALQVVNQEPTQEHNGVTITVPVGSVTAFNVEAREFFKFWDPGTVLINGEPNQSIWDATHPDRIATLDPDVVLTNGGASYVVMGCVPYPAPDRIWTGIYDRIWTGIYDYNHDRNIGFAVRVPIGSVNFTPSREALNLKSRKTEEVLDEIESFLRIGLEKSITDQIDAVATYKEAFELAQRLRPMLPRNRRYALAYRGDRIPTANTSMLKSGRRFTIKLTPSSWANSDKADTSGIFDYGVVMKSPLIVTGFTGKTLYASIKAKSRRYALDLGALSTGPTKDMSNYIHFVATPLPSPWCDDIVQVDMETIKAVVLPPDGTPVVNSRPKYHIMGQLSRVSDSDILPADAVCWLEVDFPYASLAKLLNYDESMATVRKNEVARFKRDHPTVPHFSQWIRTKCMSMHWKLTPCIARLIEKNGLNVVAAFVGVQTMDPDIADLVGQIPFKLDRFGGYEIPNEVQDTVAWWRNMESFFEQAENKISTFYPLFAGGKTPDFAAIAKPLSDQIDRLVKRHPIMQIAQELPQSELVRYINDRYLLEQHIHLHPMTY